MYVQEITLFAPQGKMADLRAMIEQEYLPAVRQNKGFVHGYLLEQIDAPDTAKLTEFWDSQSDLENVRKTQLLTGSTQSLAANLPGLRIQQQGYIVQVSTENIHA